MTSRCYTGNCGGVNVRNGTCETLKNCNWCRPPPHDKCEGCQQYSNLTYLDIPPTNLNPAFNNRDSALFELSGGMSLYNGHWRPTVVPPYGGSTKYLIVNNKRYPSIYS